MPGAFVIALALAARLSDWERDRVTEWPTLSEPGYFLRCKIVLNGKSRWAVAEWVFPGIVEVRLPGQRGDLVAASQHGRPYEFSTSEKMGRSLRYQSECLESPAALRNVTLAERLAALKVAADSLAARPKLFVYTGTIGPGGHDSRAVSVRWAFPNLWVVTDRHTGELIDSWAEPETRKPYWSVA